MSVFMTLQYAFQSNPLSPLVKDDSDLVGFKDQLHNTGSSRLMRISLLRISLLRFFKTITKIWLMRFYGLFILLLRT